VFVVFRYWSSVVEVKKSELMKNMMLLVDDLMRLMKFGNGLMKK